MNPPNASTAARRSLTSPLGPINWVRRNAWPFVFLLLALALAISSPLFLYPRSPGEAKDLAEVIDHVCSALAVLGGLGAVVVWVFSRMDRKTDLVVTLHARFSEPGLQAGKNLMEDLAKPPGGRCYELDRVLSFYVLICGVRSAGEVPEKSLSICFRYWLAHYYRVRADGTHHLRDYINTYYPTLRAWLLEDAAIKNREKSFFRPHDFWKTAIELQRDQLWPDGSR